jgi:hypothetical protein
MTADPIVTQGDRDAAASAYFAWIASNPVVPAKMRAGEADGHSMVQAFARHRLASLPAQPEPAKPADLCAESAHNSTEVGKLIERELVEALERCAKIVERNLYHQHEKIEDVPRIARAALAKHTGGEG